MSETATTTPQLTPELAQRVAKNKIARLAIKAQELREQLTTLRDKAAGTALARELGIDGEFTYADALSGAVASMEARGLTFEAIAKAAADVMDIIERQDWLALVRREQKEQPGAPAADEPKPEASPRSGVRRIAMPELPKIEPPSLPTLSPLAAQLASELEPRVKAMDVAAKAELISHIEPVIKELVDQINAAIPSPGGSGASIDEGRVKDLVGRMLGNGTGEEIRKMVASRVPAELSQVLDKAAQAILAAGPKPEHNAELKSAKVPKADPAYHWTDEMVSYCDLLSKASESEPQNALLVGPTGCGKSDWAEQMAARLGRRFFRINAATVEDDRQWFGVKGASGGSTYFRKSEFWLAMEASNMVIFIDEINRVPPHVLNPLIHLLDHHREAYIEVVGETLRVGSGNIIIGAANEGHNFTGTHPLDDAVANRFTRRIEVSYLPKEVEVKVVKAKASGITDVDAENLVEIANTIRAKATGIGGGLEKSLSTRQVIAAARDFVIAGPSTFKITVFSHFSTENGTSSERAQVIQMFEGKGYRFDKQKPSKRNKG